MAINFSLYRALIATEATAALPRISAARLLEAPENAALLKIWTDAPADSKAYTGKTIGVVATDGVEEIELTTVLHFFRARGAVVDLIAPKKPIYPDSFGLQIPAIRETHILTIHYIEPGGWIAFDKAVDGVEASSYDALIVVGGAWSPDTLRSDPKVRRLFQDVAKIGKIVAAICHGPWVLSDAGLLKGKKATGWWSMQPDLENAGATYVDSPLAVDGNTITARAPWDLSPFVEAIGEKLSSAK